MKNISWKYLEIAKNYTGDSFYKIANDIGATPTRINQCKNGKAELNDSQLFKLAQIANVPASKVIAEVHMNKAKSQEEKGFWKMVGESKELADNIRNCILC